MENILKTTPPTEQNPAPPLLEVRDLSVEITTLAGRFKALADVDMRLPKGEMVGLVGESGCGKSLTSLAIVGLLPAAGRVSAGHILFEGRELTTLTEEQLCQVRGRDISMVFQEPMTALNPLLPVGQQIAEAYWQHGGAGKGKQQAEAAALSMMEQVGLSRVQSLYWEYPHQLSGGMKQRIVIAMALVNRPILLIADEPTTALDVTIQHQILELMGNLSRSLSTTVLLISHDLGVVREVCRRVIVMYAGYVVEQGEVDAVLARPLHPYTQKLLDSIPTPDKKGRPLYTIPGVVAPLAKRKTGCCSFSDRCHKADEKCRTQLPPLEEKGARQVRCFYPEGGD